MSKLSDKFLYYLFWDNGVLRAKPPTWQASYPATGSQFFLRGRSSAGAEPTNTTFNLKER